MTVLSTPACSRFIAAVCLLRGIPRNRHTNAMLLQAQRVDIATIALWLGHESVKTTYIYQHADNKLKQEAIDRTAPIGTPPGRYKPPDQLLAFLESLSNRRHPQGQLK
jgi:integrase